MCALVVGLPAIRVLGVEDDPGEPLRVHVETTATVVGCTACGTRAWLKDQRPVALVDLAAFGRPAVLVWHKRRWRCPEPACGTATFTETQPAIAAPRAGVTDRAGRWMTRQVGQGQPVSAVAGELGCDWHTVMDAVVAYGTPLIEDPDRIEQVSALGLDETLFVRTGTWRRRSWVTSIVDVTQPAQLLDVVEGRTAKAPSAWLEARPAAWRVDIAWAALDLSGPYRKTFNDTLPDAVQVADPFHVIKLANTRLDDVRRRVQQETLGHRGHRDDPLYRSRRLLTKAHERLDDQGEAKLLSFLDAGDPHGEVRMAWHAKETLRGLFDQPAEAAAGYLAELIESLLDRSMPRELQQLGRTLRRWSDEIVAWHQAQVTNGPTEAMNSLIKRIKRVGFGFRRFRNYRLRVLLYAGRPNWDQLATITPAPPP
ncbi:ISL3 family transposase [Iamia sp. SCSIO 61187]|uniref:ISL3 family transposase n=1 Tax=Iamia sp. SCSIO 61187 TaxID=2722752 RepID=UPI001C638538|nr:ISL3 family transposase [Iamia sp. SCSIO 61187]QYG93454.1 ISL3 family transposase [Iamia sp. SCSIO 61187]QYG95214.1 ISL3 family transposase [Iamia sp. SCSIO 61187]